MLEAGRLAERRGWSSPVVVEPEALTSVLPGGDSSTCVVAEREQQGPFRPWLGLGGPDSDFTVLQARPGTEPPGLEPLPAWLRQSGAPVMSAVIGLFDLWAHGFLAGFYLGGIEWFCRHGKDLDAALRADWNTLITAFEARAQEE